MFDTEHPVRPLTWAMLADLGIGCLVAGAALGTSHSLARFTHVLPVTVLALLYPLLLPRLRQRGRGGYRGVLAVALLQLAGLGWFASGSGYPRLLWVGQGAQALAVVAVLWLAARPSLRREFGYRPPSEAVKRGHRAAVTLVVIAPLIAELTLGSTQVTQLAGLLFYWPAYGAGALLIRELVRRTGRGLPSMLVLGLGYGLIVEGLALQSLTSTTLYPNMAGLAPRLAGFNTAYSVMVLSYHAVFSIVIPIVIAELSQPIARTRTWLAGPSVAATGTVALLGFAVLRTIPLMADPGYLMPIADDLLIAGVAGAAGLLALRGIGPRRPAAQTDLAIPVLPVVAGVAFLATVVFLGLLVPLPGARHAGYAPTAATSWIAIGVALAIGGAVAVLAPRWVRSRNWTNRHSLAAITGALLGHTLIGLLALAHDAIDRDALIAFAILETALMIAFIRHTPGNRRARRSAGRRVTAHRLASL